MQWKLFWNTIVRKGTVYWLLYWLCGSVVTQKRCFLYIFSLRCLKIDYLLVCIAEKREKICMTSRNWITFNLKFHILALSTGKINCFQYTLQMKDRWESNINVWFRFMYSQKWNCTALLFPKQNINVLAPNFHIHVSVSNLYISRIGLRILLQPNRQTDPGNI
jgi:hypothetical protein